MTELVSKNLGYYRFRMVREISDGDLGELISIMEKPAQPARGALSGRGIVHAASLHDLGPVVVKKYSRGGLVRHLISGRYLHLGKMRPHVEFDLLIKAREAGVSVPEPLGFAWRGAVLYQGWLFTRQIPGERNLGALSVENETLARRLIDAVVRQVSLLIEHGIYHIDLHPGNVLLDSTDRVHLVDFDKARSFTAGKNKLRDLYLCRWRRAVIKHGLPDYLTEIFSAGLRRDFEISARAA